jgi:hypothetical protein
MRPWLARDFFCLMCDDLGSIAATLSFVIEISVNTTAMVNLIYVGTKLETVDRAKSLCFAAFKNGTHSKIARQLMKSTRRRL